MRKCHRHARSRQARVHAVVDARVTSHDDVRRFSGARRSAGGLVPVWRDCLLDAETPVSAFAKLRARPVRVSARVRAGRRRDVGALHVPGHRAARRVAATDGVVEDWTPGKGWHGARTPADPLGGSARARARRTSPWTCRSSARSGAAPSAISRTTSCGYIERLPQRAAARRSRRPTRCSCSRDALVIIDNLRVAGARGRRRAGRCRRRATRAATRARRRGARHRCDDRATARARAASRRSISIARAPPATGTSRTRASKFERDVERIREYIFAGDCFPGAARAAHRGAARLRPGDALSRAARAQPVAVHVPPRARWRGARGQLARAARARGRRTRDRAPDRGHAPARAHARGGRARCAPSCSWTRRSGPST